ncbi:MAG: excinuclease ABC subunit A, partial [Polyangiaceae bacterium]|nr:excinuclease ABC subunit A [Polyangiaceae bacterium]
MNRTILRNARTHNLQGICLEIDPGQLIAITGVSGSGKTSLCLDTLYAEGQRRFVESFSPYARQFLERHERPPIDSLDPVPAAIAVRRHAQIKSSRSTVATMADIEPYLSAIFSQEARPVCPSCAKTAVWTDAGTAASTVSRDADGARVIVLAPSRADSTVSYLDIRDILIREGHTRLWVADSVRDINTVKPSEVLGVGAYVDVVVDRLVLDGKSRDRLHEAIERAWDITDGSASLVVDAPNRTTDSRGDLLEKHGKRRGIKHDTKSGTERWDVRRGLVCPSCAQAFEPPHRGLFSYQSPVGACENCRGFGRVIGIDLRKVFPDPTKSLENGAIRPWTGKSSAWERRALVAFCERMGIDMARPWGSLTKSDQEAVVYGDGAWGQKKFPGVLKWFEYLESKAYKMHVRVLLSRYRSYDPCPACGGCRLNPTALQYQVCDLTLAEWHALEIGQAHARLAAWKASQPQGELVRQELVSRLGYLSKVGLGYLTLDRQAQSLSGGEAQRVSLTAALGASLSGALIVLDEPTVGLHATDIPPLIESMRCLSDRGNSVLVVEHDSSVIQAADRVIELGPGAGILGGRVLFDGTATELRDRADLPTGRVLAGIDRARNGEHKTGSEILRISGARANNLANMSVDIPLGVFCAISGPSGSGKSTLAEDVLYRGLARKFGDYDTADPGECDSIVGAECLAGVTLVDQDPLGRTSRGNAATYTKA